MTTTTFKGARYIVKFADPIEWNATRTYEAIESVQYNGFTYISKQPVPVGVQLDNTDFWLLWADPNAQMEQLRELVAGYVDDVEDLSDTVAGLVSGLADEIETRGNADTAIRNEIKFDTSKLLVFDTVSDMKVADNLSVGAICKTQGFNVIGDNGSAYYLITDTGSANEKDIIQCGSLYANYIFDYHLTPQKFGAVSGKVTDVSAIVNHCFEYLDSLNANEAKVLYIENDIMINDTVTIPRYCAINGVYTNESSPIIYVNTGCSKAFIMGVQTAAHDIYIKNITDDYRNFTAFECEQTNAYDSDIEFDNVRISYAGKGIISTGRNIKINNCEFVHCRYGVYYDIDPNATQLRGLQIINCRFHGIGEEADIAFMQSAGIYIKNENSSNLVITGCMFDQGATAFEGYTCNLIFSNNFIESWGVSGQPLFYSVAPVNTTHPYDGGTWLINGNKFIGKSGYDAMGIANHEFPEEFIHIENNGRIKIVDNVFQKSSKCFIYLKTTFDMEIANNEFLQTGLPANMTNEAAFVYLATPSSRLVIKNNYSASTTPYCSLVYSEVASAAFCEIENNYMNADSIIHQDSADFSSYGVRKNYQLFASGASAAEFAINYTKLPDKFIVSRTNDLDHFEVTRHNKYFSSGVSANGNYVSFLKIALNGTTGITFTVVRLDTSTMTVAALGNTVPLQVWVEC